MSVIESLFVGVFGMAVVFIVLVGLSLLLRLQSTLIARFSQKKPAKAHVSEAADAAPAAAQAQTDTPAATDVKPAPEVPVDTPPSTQVPFAAPVKAAARMPVVATMKVRAPALMPVPAPAFHARSSDDGNDIVTAPVAGTVIEIMTVVGTKVKRGDLLLLLDAMKMENGIAATRDGTVTKILTSCGKSCTAGTPLVVIQ